MTTTGQGGISAPPNRCDVKGRLVSLARSAHFPDKHELTFALLASAPREGPDLARRRVGTTVAGFTFESTAGLHPGSVFLAEAEYLGDARRGLFQLSRLRQAEP